MLRAASVPGAFLGKIAGEEVAHPFSQNVHEDSYHRLLRQRNAAWRFQKRVQTASHVEELNTGVKEIGGSLQHHSGPKKAAPLAAQYTDLHVPRLPRLLVMLMLQLNSRIGISLSLSACRAILKGLAMQGHAMAGRNIWRHSANAEPPSFVEPTQLAKN